MKTVKTVNGVKRIKAWDIPIQLSVILKEHRITPLIDKLLADLNTYVDYKFGTKASAKQLQEIKLELDTLKKSDIDTDLYSAVFESILQNESTVLSNTLFYGEIDSTLKETLFQSQLFNEIRHVVFR